MTDGTPGTSLPLRSSLNHFYGNVDTGTGMEGPVRVSSLHIATQIAVDGGLAFSSWAALNAVAGSVVGERAEVYGDAGTHTDPVVGGTKQNSGVYGWSSSPAGWQWLSAESSLRGTTIHSTSGAPSNAIGIDGDWAIDPATYAIWGPKALGVWPAGSIGAAAAAAATAADRIAVAADKAAADADAIATAADRVAADRAATDAIQARDIAQAMKGIFATTAAAIGLGVIGYASLVGGSSGTDGAFALAFTGGTGSGAAGRFVVSGGAVVAIFITAPGSYTVAPSFSFAASSGLTGASAAAVLGVNVDVGEYFYTPAAAGTESLDLWRVDAGPAATWIKDYPNAGVLRAEDVALLTEPIPVGKRITRKKYYPATVIPAVGAVVANTVAPLYFTNPTGSVTQNTFYTTATTKYLLATATNYFILKSLHRSVDQEVDVWIRSGTVYLRLDDSGKAIYFNHDGNSTNGTLGVGIVTGVKEGTTTGTTQYALYANANLVGTVTGYTKTASDGQYFTFGVSGLDIYMKYNGVEFCRFRDYRHYVEGAVAVRGATATDGPRKFDARHLERKFIYSDPQNNVVDMRDYDVRGVAAVGTIGAASNSLVLTKKANFKVADWVIIETGGEAGTGLRGTHGVGGTWPIQSYVDTATLQADLTKPHQTYAWAEDTGNVWQYSGTLTTWLAVSAASYYVYKAIPLAVQARITAISADGLTLTLDTNSVAAATDANVYLNNSPMLDIVLGRQRATPGILADLRPITPNGLRVVLPGQRLAICNYVFQQEKTNWDVVGETGCEVFSPNGTPCAGWWIKDSSRCFVKRIDLTGNHGLDGFALDMIPGIQWGGYRADGSINPYFRVMANSQTAIGQGAGYTRGYFINESTDSEVWDCKVTDIFQVGFGTSFSNNCWGRRIAIRQNDPMQQYIQWLLLISDGDNCGMEDCSVNSDYLVGGCEAFKMKNAKIIRPSLYNASMSMNDANGLIDTPYVHVTGNNLSPSFSVSNPMININSNIGAANSGLGCMIINATLVQDDYVDASNDVLTGIIINTQNKNVTVLGGRYKSPDYLAPATLTKGARGIISDGPNTIVDGFFVEGLTKAGDGWANIHLWDGTGRAINCKANEIRADNLPRTISATPSTLYEGNEIITWAGSADGTMTLPDPTGRGRSLLIRSTCAFTLSSASSNVEPLAGGALGTAILPAGAGKWARLEDTGFIASSGFVKRWMIVAAG